MPAFEINLFRRIVEGVEPTSGVSTFRCFLISFGAEANLRVERPLTPFGAPVTNDFSLRRGDLLKGFELVPTFENAFLTGLFAEAISNFSSLFDRFTSVRGLDSNLRNGAATRLPAGRVALRSRVEVLATRRLLVLFDGRLGPRSGGRGTLFWYDER